MYYSTISLFKYCTVISMEPIPVKQCEFPVMVCQILRKFSNEQITFRTKSEKKYIYIDIYILIQYILQVCCIPYTVLYCIPYTWHAGDLDYPIPPIVCQKIDHWLPVRKDGNVSFQFGNPGEKNQFMDDCMILLFQWSGVVQALNII